MFFLHDVFVPSPFLFPSADGTQLARHSCWTLVWWKRGWATVHLVVVAWTKSLASNGCDLLATRGIVQRRIREGHYYWTEVQEYYWIDYWLNRGSGILLNRGSGNAIRKCCEVWHWYMYTKYSNASQSKGKKEKKLLRWAWTWNPPFQVWGSRCGEFWNLKMKKVVVKLSRNYMYRYRYLFPRRFGSTPGPCINSGGTLSLVNNYTVFSS